MATKNEPKMNISLLALVMMVLATQCIHTSPTRRLLQDDDWDDNNPDPPDYNSSDY
jgi:hypothetical protein